MLSWVSVDQARQVGTVLGDTPAVEGGVVSGPAHACTQASSTLRKEHRQARPSANFSPTWV